MFFPGLLFTQDTGLWCYLSDDLICPTILTQENTYSQLARFSLHITSRNTCGSVGRSAANQRRAKPGSDLNLDAKYIRTL